MFLLLSRGVPLCATTPHLKVGTRSQLLASLDLGIYALLGSLEIYALSKTIAHVASFADVGRLHNENAAIILA